MTGSNKKDILMSLEAKLKENYGKELSRVDDIEELNLDGLVSISKISDSDKEYLEQFTNLSMLSASGLQLTTVENLPNLPSVATVCQSLTSLALS